MQWRLIVRLVTVFVFGMLVARPVLAQITTGTVSGTVARFHF